MKEGLRIDKWLWFTRFFKTRGLAAAAVKGGHVKLNGARAKVSQRAGVGDRLDVKRGQLSYRITVRGIPTRRGPAKEAAECYVEEPESIKERERLTATLRSDHLQMPRTPGRPDKHTRRALRKRGREVR